MPNNDMKRFVKVIMGLLIILVIIKPFIMAKDMGDQFQRSMTLAEAYIEQTDSRNKNNEVTAFQNNTALDIYKQNLAERVANIVKTHKDMANRDVKVSLEIENDMSKEDFGSIKSMQVNIAKGSGSSIKASAIEPVKINTKTVINKKQGEYNLNNSKLSQDLRSEIGTALGLKDADISIDIQE
jgi:stage III sporulation protein AF